MSVKLKLTRIKTTYSEKIRIALKQGADEFEIDAWKNPTGHEAYNKLVRIMDSIKNSEERTETNV